MTFRDRLSSELGRVYSYVLEEKGGRSVKTLWTKALSLLPDSILPHLSDFVTENVDEAGKCWIVDRPTATAFHMMRSVECVLRVYKKLITGKDAQTVTKKGLWYDGFGTIVNHLDTKLGMLKGAGIQFGRLELNIGILRPLSKLYRDPLAHPELKKLKEEDAKLAFEHGLSAISTMVQDAIDGGPHLKIQWQVGLLF
jgi:hypothetical protein